MKRGDLVFVYGTLRRDQAMDMTLLGGEWVANDAIHGKLYTCGGYPALKLDPDTRDIVIGELFRIRDRKTPMRLDRYEGYPHLYDRVRVQTLTKRDVWVYVHNSEFDENRRIPSGDWIVHQKRERDLVHVL